MDEPDATQSILAGPGRRLGYQCWCDLLFVHWRLPIAVVESRLPPGLSVDPWQGDAWLGLVAFRLRGVRPWWLPAVPRLSTFLEVNLRTYVRCGGESGVWFFSLDATSTPAVLIGRWRWHFNYHRARLAFCRSGSRLRWSSQRLWPSGQDAHLALEAELHPAELHPAAEGRFAADAAPGRPARCGTLEHFLVERYRYFALSRAGELASGVVAHEPYRLLPAEVVAVEETLTHAAGLQVNGPPEHACYSLGVASTVYPPLAIAAGSAAKSKEPKRKSRRPAIVSSSPLLLSTTG